jgi:DNA-binding CsgD family transcriptional regulator
MPGEPKAAWTVERVLDDLERLALRSLPRDEFFAEAAVRLAKAMPFDGACWHTLDPGSSLITQHRLQNIEDRFPILANNEYAVDDVNKFAQLARSRQKAATLATATAGHPERSPRFRDLLSPGGYGPELRCAFVADRAVWGALILIRRAEEPDFDERDVGLLARASTLFASSIRRGLVAEASIQDAPGPHAPGVVELDSANSIVRVSSTAEPLLAELSGTTAQAGLASPAIAAVAAATRAAVAATAHRSSIELPNSVLRTPAGTWLVLHGALLGSTRSGDVAVFVQRAHPTLIAPLLLKAYGLTAREEEVAQLILRGATNVQAAQSLKISPHTVSDHIKAVFEKTGARTRGELSATVFFGEHLPRIQSDVPLGDDASYLDAPRPRGRPDSTAVA